MSFLQLKLALQRNRAGMTTFQITATLVLGIALVVWGEIAAFFALRSVTSVSWSAALVLVLNGIALAGVNLFIMRRRRLLTLEQAAEQRRLEAAVELEEAAASIGSAREQALERVVEPVIRYKTHAAVAATFVTGYLVAKALFPVGPVSRGRTAGASAREWRG